MQKHTNDPDFFSFYIAQPTAILTNGVSEEDVIEELMESFLFPVAIIRDKEHPFFKETVMRLEAQGVKQKVVSIILFVGYHKEYLS